MFTTVFSCLPVYSYLPMSTRVYLCLALFAPVVYPGRVVTVEVLASLVSEAYAGSFTPVNIMKGFKKTGIWPINPGEVTDRQIIPSKALSS